jgi:hypothetical protein
VEGFKQRSSGDGARLCGTAAEEFCTQHMRRDVGHGEEQNQGDQKGAKAGAFVKQYQLLQF